MIYPHIVRDIDTYTLYEYKDRPTIYAIGSIERDRFIQVDESRKKIIQNIISLMDGQHSITDIEMIIERDNGSRVSVEELYNILKRADLLYEQGNQDVIKNEFDVLGIKVFEIPLNKFKKTFASLSNLATPLYVVAIIAFFLTSIFCVLNYSSITVGSLLGFTDNYLRNIIITLLIMLFGVFFHELAHAIVASKCGIIPRKITLSLYLYISPIIYIKLPGLYTIKPKARIIVWGAGIVTNMIFACIGLFFSILLKDYGISENVISIIDRFWYINSLLAIANLCPLLPLDGYFMLATVLKIPNLRRGAFNVLRMSIKEKKVRFNVTQFFYFILSVILMLTIIGKEILSMVEIFKYNIRESVFYAFWSIRQYIFVSILILILLLIKRMKR